jgi:hypothetical protein
VAEEQKKEQDIKKLVQSLTEALSYRYGRPPTPEELAHALAGEPEQAQAEQAQKEELEKAAEPPTPKILDFHIFYGMKKDPNGASVEDPQNPLFYGDGDKRWFDVEKGEWTEQKPMIVDHLHSRCLGDGDNQRDLFDAIINGVMDEEDYNLLSKAHDLLDPRCHKAYSLMNRLREDTQNLEKALQKSDDEDDYEPIEDGGESSVEASQDVVAEIIDGAGVNPRDMPGARDADANAEAAVSGTNAHAEIKEATLEPGVEIRVRRLIQEEIANALDLIRQEMWKALQEAVGGDDSQEPLPEDLENDETVGPLE